MKSIQKKLKAVRTKERKKWQQKIKAYRAKPARHDVMRATALVAHLRQKGSINSMHSVPTELTAFRGLKSLLDSGVAGALPNDRPSGRVLRIGSEIGLQFVPHEPIAADGDRVFFPVC